MLIRLFFLPAGHYFDIYWFYPLCSLIQKDWTGSKRTGQDNLNVQLCSFLIALFQRRTLSCGFLRPATRNLMIHNHWAFLLPLAGMSI